MTFWSRRRWRVLLVAASLVGLVGVALLVWQRQARLGAIRLLGDRSAMVRIVDARGRDIVPASVTSSDAAIRLPAGTYSLIAAPPDALSIAATREVPRGRTIAHRLDSDAGQMGPAIPVHRLEHDRFAFVDFGSRRDLLVIRGAGPRAARYDLAAGRTVWDVAWAPSWSRRLGQNRLTAEMTAEARRLDDDDWADAIWEDGAGLVAISGATGQPLWLAAPGWGLEPANWRWLGDIDNDGIDDLVWIEAQGTEGRIETRSGRHGGRLWWFDLTSTAPHFLPVPPAVHRLGGRELVLAVFGSRLFALEAATGRTAFGPVALGFRPTVPVQAIDRDGDGRDDTLSVGGDAELMLIAGRAGHDVVMHWQTALAHAEFQWLGAGRLLGWGNGGATPAGDGVTLTGAAVAADGRRWQVFVPGPPRARGPCPALDVNGDGCLDPIVGSQAVPAGVTPPAGPPDDRPVIETRDGTTGEVLWAKPMPASPYDGTRKLDPLLVGPDIDGDRVAELFVASFAAEATPDPFDPILVRDWFYVDAISGADGASLWWWRGAVSTDPSGRRPALCWRSRGLEGLPDLLAREGPAQAWVLRAEDGALLAALSGQQRLSALDLDKDGTEELIVAPTANLVSGTVAAYRGDWPGGSPPPRPDPGTDPRRMHLLPWVDAALIRDVAGSMPAAAVLLALPAFAVLRAARTRSLLWMFAGVAAIALAIAGVPLGPSEPPRQVARPLEPILEPIHRVTGRPVEARAVRIAVGLPLVVALPACWAWRRRWGRVLIAWGASSAAIAFAWWLADRHRLGPGDWYQSSGWPWIGLWGAQVLGVAGIVRWTTFGAWIKRATPKRIDPPEAAS